MEPPISSTQPLLPRQSPISWTGNSIIRLSLHAPAAIHTRLDVLPFLFLYFTWACVVKLYNLTQFFTLALLATLVTFHVLAFLVQHWSVRMNTLMSWRAVHQFQVVQLDQSRLHALVYPREHRGKAQLVPLHVDKEHRVSFVFQKRTYEYNPSSNCFEKVLYPTHLPLSHYSAAARRTNGLSGDRLVHGFTRFGKNILEIPAPTFAELYKESLLAPFFIFQVFCIFLWMLDEHWKFSLMTLGMMLIFEATVVSGRLRSLRELRGMRNSPLNVYVYRNAKWIQISSLHLLPGDIVSISRGRDPSHVVPCDLLLLSGSVVVNEAMLTGESVPLIKEPLSTVQETDLEKPLSIKDAHKIHILFGGTRVLTHTSGSVSNYTPATKTPDGGSVCYVLQTGFGSSQGKLMRTILFSTESVSANSREAAFFILFLLIFAIAASGYVLYHMYTEDADGRYKLLLRCILIITSVVPPELPMQLALAVNTSLVALVKNMVFCTEPFRIPYAGKVDMCCFDKTGTLTTDSIIAAGVVLPVAEGENISKNPEEEEEECSLIPVVDASLDASLVLAACHSLVYVENELIGDPLELAALESVQWAYGQTGTCVPKRGRASLASATILQRYRFASALQRMSVIANVSGSGTRAGPRVLVKGSPEAIGKLFKGSVLPPRYKETYGRLARGGMRVLALAYKYLETGLTSSQASKITRDEAETDLTFAGFICFECPLRNDSRKVIRILKRSNHMVSMITGDATLTAAHVAKQVGMCSRNILILDKSEVNPGTLEWFSGNSGKRKKRFAVETISELAKEFDLCVAGPALQIALGLGSNVGRQLQYIKIFARMSPDQKEVVLTSLKEAGLITMMCGDGTNDVGALKQAHVGVALLSPPSTESNNAQQATADANARSQVIGAAGGQNGRNQKNSNLRQRKKSGKSNTEGDTSKSGSQKNRSKSAGEANMDAYSKKVEELTSSLDDADDQPPLVKLGDASIASPFTSRRMTIDSCVSIIRQGRCSLATTLQMYQILALNSLISAYSLSVLYLQGVVMGDSQMMIVALVLSVTSFMVSRSKPLKRLSPQRPASSVFSPGLFLSLLAQFAVHVAALIMSMQIVQPYIPEDFVPEVAEEFTPSLTNSVVFLLSLAQQISVYVLNYKGRPHMQGIMENKMLLNSLLVASAIMVVCTFELLPEFNEFLELTPWPSKDMKMKVGGIITFDLIGSFIVDRFFTFAFTPKVRIVD